MAGSQFRWPFPDKLRLPWRVTSAATRLGVMLAMKALVSKSKQTVFFRSVVQNERGREWAAVNILGAVYLTKLS